MKRWLAILFSVLLAGAQGVALSVSFAAASRAGCASCCGCHCGFAKCCMEEPSPAPQPLTTTPTLSISPQSQLLLLAGANLTLALPQTLPDSDSSPPASGFLRAAPVPLFQRNCALLL